MTIAAITHAMAGNSRSTPCHRRSHTVGGTFQGMARTEAYATYSTATISPHRSGVSPSADTQTRAAASAAETARPIESITPIMTALTTFSDEYVKWLLSFSKGHENNGAVQSER